MKMQIKKFYNQEWHISNEDWGIDKIKNNIFIDSLDRPSPDFYLWGDSQWDKNADKISSYQLQSTTTVKFVEALSGTREEVIAELNKLGFELVNSHYTMVGNWVGELRHRATYAIVAENEAKQKNIVSNCTKLGYVRYGAIPKNGKSRNHADGCLEAGVSCFRAKFSPDGKYFVLDTSTPALEMDAVRLSRTCDDVFRLWGEEVGTGSDGEPLLRITKKRRLN